MTRKQKLFCDEYLIDLNATRAYLAVYKNCKSEEAAASCAYKLLRNAEIKEYIQNRMAEKESKLIAAQDEVLQYLTAVMRGESTSEEIVVEGCGDGCSQARTLEKTPSEKDKLKAAELLGKRYSLFTDKVEVDADAEIKVTVEYGESNEYKNSE